MKIQKYIKILALICLFITIVKSFDLKSSTDLGRNIVGDDVKLSHSEKIQAIQATRRSLQTYSLPPTPPITLTPITNTKYPNLILYHQIPLNWTIGQLFQIKGRLLYSSYNNDTPVNFAFINSADQSQKYTFSTTVSLGSTQFTITVDTRSVPVGDYLLALYAGRSGSYSIAPIYRVRNPGSEYITLAAPPTPYGCEMIFENNRLILRWNQDGLTPLEKITFVQAFNSVEYILSNFQSQFIVPFRDFASFSLDYVTVTISSAYSSQLGLAGRISQFSTPWQFVFRAGQHTYDQPITGVQFIQQIPWKATLGSWIRIQGTTLSNINNEMEIEQPYHVISKLNLTNTVNKVIGPGTYFDTSLYLAKQGVYILEINKDTGSAAVNRPIYVGDYWPLLPDKVDQTSLKSNDQIIAEQPQGIEPLRSALLYMLNEKRQQWGQVPLEIDYDLNNLAYGHSYDMYARNFYGHVNPDGDRAQDRATKAGLFYPVSENVASGLDLDEIHFRLTRSPGHLASIVNPNNTRVGLGIVRNAQGELLVTENFAGSLASFPSVPIATNPTPVPTNPSPVPATPSPTPSSQPSQPTISPSSTITPTQIQTLRLQIRDWIATSYPTTSEDPILSTILINWLNSPQTQSIFDFTWQTNNYQTTALSASSVNGPYSTSITSYFVVGSHFRQPDASYVKFGLGVLLLPYNSLKIQVEYSQ